MTLTNQLTMKKKKSLPEAKEMSISFSLRGFNIPRFELVEPGLDITKDFDIFKLKLGINIDFSYNFEQNGYQIIFTIQYHYFLKDKNILLLDLVLITEFSIQEMKSVIKIEGNNFKIPHDLLVTFTSIAYSTARGVIHAKTQGSFLNQFILPLIDPKILVQNKLKAISESKVK
jgi:hypothetical protein